MKGEESGSGGMDCIPLVTEMHI